MEKKRGVRNYSRESKVLNILGYHEIIGKVFTNVFGRKKRVK